MELHHRTVFASCLTPAAMLAPATHAQQLVRSVSGPAANAQYGKTCMRVPDQNGEGLKDPSPLGDDGTGLGVANNGFAHLLDKTYDCGPGDPCGYTPCRGFTLIPIAGSARKLSCARMTLDTQAVQPTISVQPGDFAFLAVVDAQGTSSSPSRQRSSSSTVDDKACPARARSTINWGVSASISKRSAALFGRNGELPREWPPANDLQA